MTKLIDADKIAARIKAMMDKYPGPVGGAMYILLAELHQGNFSPTPPVQPDTPNPGDRVRHTNKVYKHNGIGVIKEISKSGEKALVEWPDYDRKYFYWGGPTPSYYRLDKLEVITDESQGEL